MHKKIEKWINTGKLFVTSNCWLWLGCKNSDGYPKVSYRGNVNGKGHRVVYMLCNPSEDIEGKVVRHTCDNPLCMNPDHLVLGNSVDNVKDRVSRGRSYSHVSEEEAASVFLLRDSGMLYKDIAKEMDISIKRVEYILVKYTKVYGG